jgi:hypothetical protein
MFAASLIKLSFEKNALFYASFDFVSIQLLSEYVKGE